MLSERRIYDYRGVGIRLESLKQLNVSGINANSPKSTEVNINYQGLVKILLFIVQEKIL